MLIPAAPSPVRLTTWGAGSAASLPIGWFDLDKLIDVLNSPGETGEGAGPGGAPLSENAEFIRRLAATLQPPLPALSGPHGTLEWPSPLLSYQRVGIAALLSRRSLLLADDMGLGKTVQAIAAVRILAARGELKSALIVCPASLLLQWRIELTRWAPDLRAVVVSGGPVARANLWRIPAHVKLVGYETLRADVLDSPDSPVAQSRWDAVILDEASRIKNRESSLAVACKRLRRDRSWALTGTPMENSPDDVVSLLEFLHGRADPETHPTPVFGSMRSQLMAVQVRRKREDVLSDLPAKQVNEVTIELPAGQREAYLRAEREGVIRMKAAGPAVTITHVFELISRLKQLCNFDPVSGESAKLTDIVDRLRSVVAEGHRALLFSQFTDSVFGIGRAAEWLREFRPVVYTGSLSTAERAAAVAEFVRDPRRKVLLLSLRAGGVGLNLQAASYVFHLDRWWNPAIEEQADARAHRMGQRTAVTVFRYLCADTIEERIAGALKRKRGLFDELVDDISMDLGSGLTEEELFGLFGLRPTRR